MAPHRVAGKEGGVLAVSGRWRRVPPPALLSPRVWPTRRLSLPGELRVCSVLPAGAVDMADASRESRHRCARPARLVPWPDFVDQRRRVNLVAFSQATESSSFVVSLHGFIVETALGSQVVGKQVVCCGRPRLLWSGQNVPEGCGLALVRVAVQLPLPLRVALLA